MGNTTTVLNEYPFLTGGSEAAELIKRFDWGGSSLGPIGQWPVSLRTTVGLLLHSAFPMLLFWGDDLISFYNDAFRPSLGDEGKHPSIGRKGSEMWADIWEVIYPLMRRVMETGKPVWREDELVPFYRNGRTEQIYWTFSYSPAYNDSGAVAGVFVTCYETTDKVVGLRRIEESRDEQTKNEARARRIIEENDRILRNAIQNAPIAICLLRGPEYVVEIASDRMFELWGKQVEAMLHKPMFEGIPEVRHQGYEAVLEHVYTNGQPYSGHNWPVKLNRFGNMQDEFVDFLFEPQFDENGKVSGMLAVALLVTEQVKARRLIEETVALRTAELATANERLLRSNEELKQFAYVTSHDLQEPIRKAAIFTTQLEEILVDPSPQVKTIIDKIFKSHRRILSLIRDILNYSELGARAVVFERVDLQAIVEQIGTDFEMLIAQNQAIIKTPVPLPVIDAVASQMFQLFSNLVSNALKFARADVPPVIEIICRVEGDQVFIDVADNGIGFDEQHADQIFAIFQRLHRQADYSGNGIGLALTRKIIANHHGKIGVNSKPGEGTTFHIQLPLRQGVQENSLL